MSGSERSADTLERLRKRIKWPGDPESEKHRNWNAVVDAILSQVAPEIQRLGRERDEALYDAGWYIRHAHEVRKILKRLVEHDVAADKQEGLDHCLELQLAMDVLEAQSSEGE